MAIWPARMRAGTPSRRTNPLRYTGRGVLVKGNGVPVNFTGLNLTRSRVPVNERRAHTFPLEKRGTVFQDGEFRENNGMPTRPVGCQ
jgi:hypothetical protein